MTSSVLVKDRNFFAPRPQLEKPQPWTPVVESPPKERVPVTKAKQVKITATELEVLKLLAKGYENKEIGERLYISPNTARTHVDSLLRKFGVTKRIQIVTLAIKLKVIKFSDCED